MTTTSIRLIITSWTLLLRIRQELMEAILTDKERVSMVMSGLTTRRLTNLMSIRLTSKRVSQRRQPLRKAGHTKADTNSRVRRFTGLNWTSKANPKTRSLEPITGRKELFWSTILISVGITISDPRRHSIYRHLCSRLERMTF